MQMGTNNTANKEELLTRKFWGTCLQSENWIWISEGTKQCTHINIYLDWPMG